MITIETKPGVTIGFYKPPVMPNETETRERKCLYVNDTILHVYYVGKLSEIKEEQAKELVYLGKMEFEIVNPITSLKEKRYVDLNEWYAMKEFEGKHMEEAYKNALKTAAISVGIEEKDFDQYLVIKL